MTGQLPCDGKLRFASLPAAVDALARRKNQPRSRVKRLYKCPFCGWWHLTKRRKYYTAPTPFPIQRGYWAVIVDGSKVWQSEDEKAAAKVAKANGGTVVAAFDRRNR